MFKDITLALTPSDVCDCAVDTSFSFARRFDSMLNIIHVCGPEESWGAMRHLEVSGKAEKIKQELEDSYREKLDNVKNYKIHVVPGIPCNEILRLARNTDADLIVMGSSTYDITQRRQKMWGMAGSSLEKVAQRAKCPVMIVNKQTQPCEKNFKTILAPTDFSSQSKCAVHYACQLCRHYDAELIVFHAVDGKNISYKQVGERISANKQRIQDEFGNLFNGIKGVQIKCWAGQPDVEIVKLAQVSDASVIVMAHHSKGTESEIRALGSTIATVSLNSSCVTMSVNRHFDLRCGLMYDTTGQAVAREQGGEEARV